MRRILLLCNFRFCLGLLIVVSWSLFSASTEAQPYPSKEIRFICAFPPGSGSDVLVRYFAEKIRVLTGKVIVVENRPGAAGNIAMEHVARSKPDGYTIYVHAASSAAASMHLFKNPPVDVAKQLKVAATINRQPYMLLVDAGAPYKSLSDLTAALRRKGSKGSYGSPNTISSVVSEIYKGSAGLETVEINYKVAADMLNDFASGAIDFAVADPVFSLAQAKAGRLRILGITTKSRMNASRDLPTLAEQGIPIDLTGWWAAMVPADTPAETIGTIHDWFVQVVGSEETKAFLAQFGGDPLIESPEAAQVHLNNDIKNWGEWVRMAKIEPQG